MEYEISQPASPMAQYLNSSSLSLCIFAVLESEIPIDDSPTIPLLTHVFLPINPRFSSVMVGEMNGVKQWKRVEVKIQDHIKIPIFPDGKSIEFYDEKLNDYLSKIAMDPLPQSRPLWEIHIIKYPTSNAAGNIVFKLHHALGDGFSLMGALLSCLQRADNLSLPLTFPSRQSDSKPNNIDKYSIFGRLPQIISCVVETALDFGSSLLKSSLVEDDQTRIRSGDDGVEFRPRDISTLTFSLDDIKQIKSNLQVTINDVITGIIFLGSRLYMQETRHEPSNTNSTALVLLNTRNLGGYKSVRDMLKTDAEMPWGNHFAFLHVPIPNLTKTESSNPLNFILKTHSMIMKKRNSAAVFLNGMLLEALRKFKGPEATAQYLHRTLKNTSIVISNMIGPIEKMAVGNHPIRGLYFTASGNPQSLTITIVSYMRQLRVAVASEQGFIDHHEFNSCIQTAFNIIFKAAVHPASKPNPFKDYAV